jgi:hypothetical protein
MKTIKVGIVGVRKYDNYNEFKKLLEEILTNLEISVSTVVSGGAKGIDTLAEKWAKENNIPVIIHKPDYSKYPGYYAPIVRNEFIVDDAELIIAFWDGKSKGTKNTIDITRRREKDLIIKYI